MNSLTRCPICNHPRGVCDGHTNAEWRRYGATPTGGLDSRLAWTERRIAELEARVTKLVLQVSVLKALAQGEEKPNG